MNLFKTLIIGTTILFASYTAFVWRTIDIGTPERNCQQGISNFLAPWGSGCFYIQDWDDVDFKITQPQIILENRHLKEFKRREGVSPEILWYRAKFNRRYMNELKKNFEQLHYMHKDYTLSEHTRLDRQVEYLRFLAIHDLSLLAQETINQYCEDYLPIYREDVVEELSWRLKRNRLMLKLKTCIDTLHPKARKRLSDNFLSTETVL